jgi:hypothetical protein
MAFIRIPNAGSTGVIKDLSAHELPLGVWTDCTNVRFYDGRVHQSPGHEAIYGATSVIQNNEYTTVLTDMSTITSTNNTVTV